MSRLVVISAAIVGLAISQVSARAEPATFNVVVQRGETVDGLTLGKLSVNDEDLGDCFENASTLIPAGEYKGELRYKSGKNFVQGPGGKLGMQGDFLLEVAGVKDRTDILFHPGNKVAHATGCIMCGPALTDAQGVRCAPEALKKLRLLFYDNNDMPNASPDKRIVIKVLDKPPG